MVHHILDKTKRNLFDNISYIPINRSLIFQKINISVSFCVPRTQISAWSSPPHKVVKTMMAQSEDILRYNY